MDHMASRELLALHHSSSALMRCCDNHFCMPQDLPLPVLKSWASLVFLALALTLALRRTSMLRLNSSTGIHLLGASPSCTTYSINVLTNPTSSDFLFLVLMTMRTPR